MKNKIYCTSLILFSTNYLHAAVNNIYDIKPGDNLNSISERLSSYSIGPSKDSMLKEILKYNTFIKKPDLIYPGQSLIIPRLKDVVYEVKSGDTFNKIVEDYKYLGKNLSFKEQVAKTLKLNPEINDVNKIFIGQKIILGKVYDSGFNKEYAYYRVKKGDSVIKILRNLYTGVDTERCLSFIKSKNFQISNLDLIYPDQVIMIPSRSYIEKLIKAYVERGIASTNISKNKYYYEDELGFEVKKLSLREANRYVSIFQKLKNENDINRWQEVLDEVRALAFVEKNSNIENAFNKFSDELKGETELIFVKKEIKKFLTIWRDKRIEGFES